MSSDRDLPLPAGRNPPARKRSGYLTSTPDSAFRRPPPPRSDQQQQQQQQQFSLPTRHTEPFNSRIDFRRLPTYTHPKPGYSGVTFKSTTSTPTASGSKSTTSQSRLRSPLTQELGQYHRAKNSRSSFPLSTKTSRTTNLSGRISSQFHVPPSTYASKRPPTLTHAPASTKPANIMTTKTTQSLAPLWRELDDAFEERLRVKRRRDEAGIYTARRITGRQTSATNSKDNTIDVEDPDRPKTNIRPKLKLNPIDGPDTSDSDHDEPRYRPQPKIRNRKTVMVVRDRSAIPQVAAKKSAARKVNYINTTSSEEDDDDDKSQETSSGSSEKDQLDSDQYDVVMEEPSLPPPVRPRTPPEVLILDSPPRITIPLPQIDPDHFNTPVAQPPSIEPPDELLTALESLTLSTIRMQKTHQLPFLLRNLRQGFLSRCRVLGVPIYSDDRQLSLCVRYDYVAGITYKTDISEWLCPLCELHGVFRTREMLACHLQWDHAEVFSEWGQMEDMEELESWNLQLVIPEPEPEVQLETEDERKSESHSTISVSQTPTAEVDRKAHLSSTPNTPTDDPEATPTRNLFPFVSMSSSPVRRSTTASTSYTSPSMAVDTKPISKLNKMKIQEEEESNFPRSASLTSRSRSTPSSNFTRSSISTTRTSSTAMRSDRPSRYPTPPPADDLLGPAAQPPYLPAKSDYGGPTVYHSYRPGGPCLFDLLNTLPLEPFGVLDWEILDREEEIYESDDVKEEYKVMHALWARWIMLNRNKFIANYYKGMIAFVDEYWKIIHRAAGWDALRYWLLMLLSNHFLSGHDVAQVLVHYEDLVGMAFW